MTLTERAYAIASLRCRDHMERARDCRSAGNVEVARIHAQAARDAHRECQRIEREAGIASADLAIGNERAIGGRIRAAMATTAPRHGIRAFLARVVQVAASGRLVW